MEHEATTTLKVVSDDEFITALVTELASSPGSATVIVRRKVEDPGILGFDVAKVAEIVLQTAHVIPFGPLIAIILAVSKRTPRRRIRIEGPKGVWPLGKERDLAALVALRRTVGDPVFPRTVADMHLRIAGTSSYDTTHGRCTFVLRTAAMSA